MNTYYNNIRADNVTFFVVQKNVGKVSACAWSVCYLPWNFLNILPLPWLHMLSYGRLLRDFQQKAETTTR